MRPSHELAVIASPCDGFLLRGGKIELEKVELSGGRFGLAADANGSEVDAQ